MKKETEETITKERERIEGEIRGLELRFAQAQQAVQQIPQMLAERKGVLAAFELILATENKPEKEEKTEGTTND